MPANCHARQTTWSSQGDNKARRAALKTTTSSNLLADWAPTFGFTVEAVFPPSQSSKKGSLRTMKHW